MRNPILCSMHICGSGKMLSVLESVLAGLASELRRLDCERMCLSLGVLFASVVIAAAAPASEYDDLTAQQQADLSRFLGWVWADGKPLNTDQVTGIRSEVRHAKYQAVVERLLAVPELGMQLANTDGEPDKRKIKAPWKFWNHSLPGGNPEDPRLLRDAIRNPNFLAGVIEGGGGRSKKVGCTTLTTISTDPPAKTSCMVWLTLDPEEFCSSLSCSEKLMVSLARACESAGRVNRHRSTRTPKSMKLATN